MRQKSNSSGPGNEVGTEAPSWNRRVISVDPLWVWAPAAEAGYLLPSALFSKHLRLFEHGGSDITPTCRMLSSRASFGAVLLIPLYGNQSTSNPNHLSRRYTCLSLFFFLDCEVTWAGTSKGWRLLLFNDYPFNSSALASRSWWLRRLREHQKWKRKKRIYEFTSTRPCRFASADETLEHIRHGWRSVGNKGDEMAALICIFR